MKHLVAALVTAAFTTVALAQGTTTPAAPAANAATATPAAPAKAEAKKAKKKKAKKSTATPKAVAPTPTK